MSFLYNNSLNLAVLKSSCCLLECLWIDSEDKHEIDWQYCLEDITNIEQSDSKLLYTIVLKNKYTKILHFIISTQIVLRFTSKDIMNTFSHSLDSFRDLLKIDRPAGIVPSFSHLYYGCGIVFQIVPIKIVLNYRTSIWLSWV